MKNLPLWYKLWTAVSSTTLLLMLVSLVHYAQRRDLPLINFGTMPNGEIWNPDAYGGVLQMLIPWSLITALLFPILVLPIALFVWRKRK